MKRLNKRVGFNFEYMLLISIFVALQLLLFNIFNRPEVKDGAAWFQGVGGIFTLIAVLAIPAIQRKHSQQQSEDDSDFYTLKAFKVAEQAVAEISSFKDVDRFYVSEVEHRMAMNSINVLYDAIDGFEVSRMSSAPSAIALVRIKHHVMDVRTIYEDAFSDKSDWITALSMIDLVVSGARKELAVIGQEIPGLSDNSRGSIWKRIRTRFGKRRGATLKQGPG